MSCKVISKKDIHVVKLELDVNLETSALEDLSVLNNISVHARTLPLILNVNGTETKGNLFFIQKNTQHLYFGVTLFKVQEFSAHFDLNFENMIGQGHKDSHHMNCILDSRHGESLSELMKSSTSQKFPIDTKYATLKAEFFFKNEITSNVKVIGKITLKIELSTKSDSIKMKNFKEILCETTFERFDNENDFTIICEGQEFGFNKTLLSMISEVFALMIQKNGKEKVEINDFSPDTIKAFQKIAFGSDAIENEGLMPELLMFAQKYLMKPLVAKIKFRLMEALTNENIFGTIKVAYLIDDHDMLKKASRYLFKNMKELKGTPEWNAFKNEHHDCLIEALTI